MKIVQKGNKQLKVADERLNDMLNSGYVEIDQKTGKVLTPAKDDELKTLKKENKELKAQVKELTEQVAALTPPADPET